MPDTGNLHGTVRMLDGVDGPCPLEPGLPYPWHAWRELARVRGLYDHMAGQVIDRAKREPAPESLIGYRRGHVIYTHAGWVLEVPGSFAEVRTEDELWVGGAGRTITLAATATGTPAGPMSAQDFLDQVAGDLGSTALTHRAAGTASTLGVGLEDKNCNLQGHPDCRR